MTPAIRLLERADIAHRVIEFDHNPDQGDYGRQASEQLGVASERVFKTLVAETSTGNLIVAIVPTSARLHLKSLAAATGTKKTFMADGVRVEKTTGYVLGGVSPLGQKKALRTFIDASAQAFDTIFVSGGRRGLEIEMAPAALASLTGAVFAAIADAG